MDPDLVVNSSDDEETLLMKENLLKIRLKKKKLAKQASCATLSPRKTVLLPARPVTPPPRPLSTLQNPFASPKSARHGSASTIQVPGSPSPQKRRPPISPARITLGIDQGRTGKDVSLRRTPEKPSKTFNQRLAETKADELKLQTRKKESAISRLSKFNPVPAFSSNTDVAEQDKHSRLNITERKVSEENLDKATGCVSQVFSLLSFYAQVSPPDYELSEGIRDYIVYGIVAAKSDTKTTTSGAKYCVITLTDLKTDMTLFLYDSAFEKYWTLALGAVCYFLNPITQKPRTAGARLSIKMTDDAGVLEIGKSADFGLCRSIKKDGTQCTAWINAKKQDVCEFHLDLSLAKTSNKRLEFASGTKLFDPRHPSKKKQKQDEEMAQHALFFGDAVTTLKADTTEYDRGVSNTTRLLREAESRQREREVLAKLLKHSSASAGHEYFDTIDPNATTTGTTDEDGEEDQDDVFNATMLRKLGFDPTKKFTVSNVMTNNVTVEEMQRDAASVDLKVEMGKGSAMFTKAGIAAVERAKSAVAASTEPPGGDDSESDLEIVPS